jgi:hypothetical protein
MIKKIVKTSLIFILLGILGFAAWTWGALNYVYSKGERAGYLQKLSKKGWVFKTWEGELAMVNLPGAMVEKFYFSIRNESVAQDVSKVLGQRVVIKYDEHKGIPVSCFGETTYFVTSVEPVIDEANHPQIK